MSDQLPLLPWGKSVPYTSPTGKKTVLYNIGTLAEALGRTSQTVRKWEIGGIIPPTPFKQNGQRLYAREHIEALVKGAEKSKLKQGSSIGDTVFTKRAFKDFERIHEEFFGKKEEDKDGKVKK